MFHFDPNVLLKYNARPHKASVTKNQNFIGKHSVTLRKIRTHHLRTRICFDLIKEVLGRERFLTDDEVKEFLYNWLYARPNSFYYRRIKNSINWNICLDVKESFLKIT